jgi:hypothetical protein
MRYLSLILSGICVSAIAFPLSVQARQERDLINALNLAQTAINRCYENKELDECDKLSRIKTTLTDWCSQGDESTCSALSTVMTFETNKLLEQSAGNVFK